MSELASGRASDPTHKRSQRTGNAVKICFRPVRLAKVTKKLSLEKVLVRVKIIPATINAENAERAKGCFSDCENSAEWAKVRVFDIHESESDETDKA
jgi:hypothetical protein